MPKITKTAVDAARPQAKQYTIWDGELKGFGLYVHPTGRKSYFVDYRPESGERRRMTIGRHGVVTAEEARKLAIGHLGGVVRGEDPALDKRTRRKAITVDELCDDYLEAAHAGLILGRGGTPKKVSTIEADESRIKAHIRPLLGRKRVIDVGRPDIAQFIEDVMSGKTAKFEKLDKPYARSLVTGGAGAAARTTGLLGSIFQRAVNKGIRPDNPVHGVRRPADKKRQRRLRPEEYARLGKALREAEDQIDQVRAGIWLIALTGARISEIEQLQRSMIQSDGRTAILGDSKTGRSLRPLSRPALDVIDALDDAGDFVLVSPRVDGDHYRGVDTAMERITKRAELKGVTAHTLRHSFASVGNDLGYSVPTIGAIIGHGNSTVTADYIHHLDAALIAAADAISAEVLRQMGGH